MVADAEAVEEALADVASESQKIQRLPLMTTSPSQRRLKLKEKNNSTEII